MQNFSTKKKGYDNIEVDNYIKNLVAQYERVLFDQKDRIEELKRQNSMLESQLSDYESKKDNINQALTLAIEKAKNIEYASKVRFAIEGERIKLFESKWTNYCKTYLSRISPKENKAMIEYLKQAKEELAILMASELNMTDDVSDSLANEDYIEECIRLNGN